ncbi:MAG: DUF3376 domain-containing protein [Propionibacteriaceae bacterium]|nr:DUF3376 domain-containing protein [Propionibacteriaceae bacterium]
MSTEAPEQAPTLLLTPTAPPPTVQTSRNSGATPTHRAAGGPQTVRAGVVMNGGISYAIWMGGATLELDRARTSAPGTAWARVLELAGTELVVDVIAGTSAGALDSAALATAIATGGSLSNGVGQLWLKSASLTRDTLLSGPPRSSVLNGTWFRNEVARLLELVSGECSAVLPAAQDDVTLFITSTRLDADGPGAAPLSDGKALLGAPDHTYRPPRVHRNHLELDAQGNYQKVVTSAFVGSDPDETCRLLGTIADAARASAGFPLAFEPFTMAGHHHLDGGALDNAPFQPVMEEILRRPRSDPGERWLLYLTPTSESKPVDVASGWTSLLGPLLTLFRESDLASDDRQLSAALEDSVRGAVRAEEILSLDGCRGVGGFRFPTPQLASMANSLLKPYQLCRARQYLVDYDKPIESSLKPLSVGFPSSLDPYRVQPGGPVWQWGIRAARRMARCIAREARSEPPLPADQLDRIAGIEDELAALADINDAIVAREVARTIGRKPAVLAALDDTYRHVYGPMEELVTIWADANGLPVAEAWQRVLATEVITQAVAVVPTDPFPRFTLHQITPRCVTAEDEQFRANKLLAGQLGGFGAFLAPGFRLHDWRWGRIDGATAIATALLAGCTRPAEAARAIEALQQAICAEEQIDLDDLLDASRRIARLTVAQVFALALDAGEVDVNLLRETLARYVTADDHIPRALRPAIRQLLRLLFGHYVRTLPRTSELDQRLVEYLREAKRKVDLLPDP